MTESKNLQWMLKVGKKAKTAIIESIRAFWYFWREKIIKYSCLLRLTSITLVVYDMVTAIHAVKVL